MWGQGIYKIEYKIVERWFMCVDMIFGFFWLMLSLIGYLSQRLIFGQQVGGYCGWIFVYIC